MEYKIVLVAKGSPVGQRAAKKAAEMAKEKNINTIHLLFVNDTDFYHSGGFVHLKKEIETGLKNIGAIIMEKLERIIRDSQNGIKVEKIALKGKTSEEILRFVSNNKIDTIIIPKDERGPIEKSLTRGEIEPFFNEIKEKVENLIIIA